MTPQEAAPWLITKPPGTLVTFWVIYDHPTDCPDGYVLRPQFTMSDVPANWEEYGIRITPFGQRTATLISKLAWRSRNPDDLRNILPPSCVNLGRQPGDDQKIMEVWVE